MENDDFDDEDDIPDDIDQVDYMLSDEWHSEIDSKSSIKYFGDFFLKTKHLDAAFAGLITRDLNETNVQKLEEILNKQLKN